MTTTQTDTDKAVECDECLDKHVPGTPCDPDELRWAQSSRKRTAEREAKMAPPWGKIELRDGSGGFRHYLDGEPISCGTGLEIQAVEYRTDDHGGYDARLPTGAYVRYEIQHVKPTKANPWGREIVWYASVGGHTVTFAHEEWFRFRWPRRS